jgi:hypothetical protein
MSSLFAERIKLRTWDFLSFNSSECEVKEDAQRTKQEGEASLACNTPLVLGAVPICDEEPKSKIAHLEPDFQVRLRLKKAGAKLWTVLDLQAIKELLGGKVRLWDFSRKMLDLLGRDLLWVWIRKALKVSYFSYYVCSDKRPQQLHPRSLGGSGLQSGELEQAMMQ